jgi:hypothetical protein
MAERTQPSTAATELTVVIDEQCGDAQYLGTRATLEAEGILPTDLQWPTGFDGKTWETPDGLRFRLNRTRPSGAKGPRKAFLAVDWWQLFFYHTRRLDYKDRAVECKARELRLARYRASPAARAAADRMLNARLGGEGFCDKAFIAFRASVVERGLEQCNYDHAVRGASHA